MNGAEKLLGKGDMLFFPSGYPKPVRVQGAFVSDEEVGKVVEFLKTHMQKEVTYNEEITNTITSTQTQEAKAAEEERDPYFAEAGRFIIEKEKGSIGMLQRFYKIGFNRAGRIMDQLADAGVVGPEVGTKPRKVEMTLEEFEEYLRKTS
jgi:S-DNA-T family DNA segregation ATPase FtsK/SpoIIIE